MLLNRIDVINSVPVTARERRWPQPIRTDYAFSIFQRFCLPILERRFVVFCAVLGGEVNEEFGNVFKGDIALAAWLGAMAMP